MCVDQVAADGTAGATHIAWNHSVGYSTCISRAPTRRNLMLRVLTYVQLQSYLPPSTTPAPRYLQNEPTPYFARNRLRTWSRSLALGGGENIINSATSTRPASFGPPSARPRIPFLASAQSAVCSLCWCSLTAYSTLSTIKLSPRLSLEPVPAEEEEEEEEASPVCVFKQKFNFQSDADVHSIYIFRLQNKLVHNNAPPTEEVASISRHRAWLASRDASPLLTKCDPVNHAAEPIQKPRVHSSELGSTLCSSRPFAALPLAVYLARIRICQSPFSSNDAGKRSVSSIPSKRTTALRAPPML